MLRFQLSKLEEETEALEAKMAASKKPSLKDQKLLISNHEECDRL